MLVDFVVVVGELCFGVDFGVEGFGGDVYVVVGVGVVGLLVVGVELLDVIEFVFLMFVGLCYCCFLFCVINV